MRKIKFRAWDGYKFTYSEKTGAQYTGLKDRNGKEIYEGDIVTFKNECMGKAEILGHVEYCELFGSYTFNKSFSPNTCGSPFQECFDNGVHSPEYLEIIGNIYENPELLDAKK